MENDTSWAIPEEIQDKLAELAAKFSIKTGASYDDINKFMVELFRIYDEYIDTMTNEQVN